MKTSKLASPPPKGAVARIQGLKKALDEAVATRDAYGEQLVAIADMLVRAGVLTQKEVGRQGVRFAIRDKFEPPREAQPKATKKR